MSSSKPQTLLSADEIARARMPSRWTFYLGALACGVGAFTLTCDSLYLSPCNGLPLFAISAIALISGIIALFYPMGRRRTAVGMLLAIVAMSVPYFWFGDDPTPRVTKARTDAARMTLAELKTDLIRFSKDNGRFPTAAAGLKALLKCPSGLEATWRGPYESEDSMVDRWGRPFVYRIPGRNPPASYDLFSVGRDGMPDTKDDIRAP